MSEPPRPAHTAAPIVDQGRPGAHELPRPPAAIPPLFTRSALADGNGAGRWNDLRLLERIGERSPRLGWNGAPALANPGLPYGDAHDVGRRSGEVAEAHRHTAHAFRFILQGSGCSTTVDGERYEMNEGDLVLTPSWTWHDHVHRGDKPMIWLDVLDISLMRTMHATFFEPYEGETQPVDAVAERSFRAGGIMRTPRKGPALRVPCSVPRDKALAALGPAGWSRIRSTTWIEYQNRPTAVRL